MKNTKKSMLHDSSQLKNYCVHTNKKFKEIFPFKWPEVAESCGPYPKLWTAGQDPLLTL